jgi:hypothetical protein
MDDGDVPVAGAKRARGAEAADADEPRRRGAAPADDEEAAESSASPAASAASDSDDDEELDLVGAEKEAARLEAEAEAATDEEVPDKDLRMVGGALRRRARWRARTRPRSSSVCCGRLAASRRRPCPHPAPPFPSRSRAPLSACA